MRAVTIRQPWAAALLAAPGPSLHPAWQTDHRGPLLIHAAKREAGDPPAGRADGPAYGALIGIVDLVDCVCTGRAGSCPDEEGFVWVLANPRPFAAPVPQVGRLGLFDVAASVVAASLMGLGLAAGEPGSPPQATCVKPAERPAPERVGHARRKKGR
jgi:hypothetical protein